ncbi:MAG: hypothetical protein JST19_09190, partial [Bacteroidetes bacterium]|nr:hypothetical protein [Bacteroidota bacterium]
GAQEIIPMKDALKAISDPVFVIMNLKDAAGKTVSHNVYWLSPGNDLILRLSTKCRRHT